MFFVTRQRTDDRRVERGGVTRKFVDPLITTGFTRLSPRRAFGGDCWNSSCLRTRVAVLVAAAPENVENMRIYSVKSRRFFLILRPSLPSTRRAGSLSASLFASRLPHFLRHNASASFSHRRLIFLRQPPSVLSAPPKALLAAVAQRVANIFD